MWESLQVEPSALWHSALEGNPHIYHYTFGLEFTTDGLPVTTIGDWSLDKRHYVRAGAGGATPNAPLSGSAALCSRTAL